MSLDYKQRCVLLEKRLQGHENSLAAVRAYIDSVAIIANKASVDTTNLANAVQGQQIGLKLLDAKITILHSAARETTRRLKLLEEKPSLPPLPTAPTRKRKAQA